MIPALLTESPQYAVLKGKKKNKIRGDFKHTKVLCFASLVILGLSKTFQPMKTNIYYLNILRVKHLNEFGNNKINENVLGSSGEKNKNKNKKR